LKSAEYKKFNRIKVAEARTKKNEKDSYYVLN